MRSLGNRLSVPLTPPGSFGRITAYSVKMRAFVASLEQIARTDTTVLIEGETGTGKELAAEALHGASQRRQGPFVVFDCGAVNRSLAAAELFGVEKGAFTGATVSRAGVCEEAEGGTLFLDEIGELPLDVQPLLLAALERRATSRLGSARSSSFDVRIIAATNRNLAEEVRARRFRQDLFYRLAVVCLHLPPLRERPEDLPVLANAFAREAGVVLSPEILIPLKAHDWPGNVRELKNTIQRLTLQPGELKNLASRPRKPTQDEAADGTSQNRQSEDLMYAPTGEMRTLPEVRKLMTIAFERRYLERILEHAHGNLSRAAEIAGVTRQSLTELALKHGLHPRDSLPKEDE